MIDQIPSFNTLCLYCMEEANYHIGDSVYCRKHMDEYLDTEKNSISECYAKEKGISVEEAFRILYIGEWKCEEDE